ncbi:MAG: hypothetical protein LBH13_09565 [Cellulomonadaceae bacterium]|jgi:DNA-directed RNA polymerase sigma subunit (sigma70/sigma32)|nr:hypothetical protein [Cellulomonadaceae bacterium]
MTTTDLDALTIAANNYTATLIGLREQERNVLHSRRDIVIQMREHGATFHEIATRLGLKQSHIQAILR